MFDYTGTYTDAYQLTMAQAYFLKTPKNSTAVFDYFFRKLPFGGGYAVFAGLEDLLDILQNFHFSNEDIDYLAKQGFNADFLEYLKAFRFQGRIFACREGELIFPNSPVVSVEADIIEGQIIETLLLNLLNFQTLIATKARRIRQEAGARTLMEFGLRRSQGPGGYYVSRAAVIGGFDSTSNVRSGRDYQIPIAGTMSHSFVQSYEDELTAFHEFAEIWPNNCVLLVDTYNSLASGVPNAIKVGKALEKKGFQLKGIRLDSGDLAYLAIKARKMLDDAGLEYVQIVASNQLDEYVIKSLLEQNAAIDVFGVGTNLAIGKPDGALDGVYKLAYVHDKPRLKLSETVNKTSLPDKKQVHRVLDNNGMFLGADVVSLRSEQQFDKMIHPFIPSKTMPIQNYQTEALLQKVMEQGARLSPAATIAESARYCQQRLQQLPMEYKRITNPHVYKVGLSEQLNGLRERLITVHKV